MECLSGRDWAKHDADDESECEFCSEVETILKENNIEFILLDKNKDDKYEDKDDILYENSKGSLIKRKWWILGKDSL